MKNKTMTTQILWIILGGILYLGGAYGVRHTDASPLIVPAGFLCITAGWLIVQRSLEAIKLLRLDKEGHIEEKDERNVAVRNRSKARSFDLMRNLLFALALGISFSSVRIDPSILTMGLALLASFLDWWYRWKFNEEM